MERRAALEQALSVEGFVLPIRLDATEIPGILKSLFYLDGNELSLGRISKEICTHLLRRRLMSSRHADDNFDIKDYFHATPLLLPPGVSRHRSVIGQAHLAINCRIALEQLILISRDQNLSSDMDSDPPIPKVEAMGLAQNAGFDGPAYSLQISFLDSKGGIYGNPDLEDGFNIAKTNLPNVVKDHVLKLLQEAECGNEPTRLHFFSWTDALQSSQYPSSIGRPARANIGYIYPDQLMGAGSEPSFCTAYAFGEIHLK